MTDLEFINNIAEACISLYNKYKILPSMTIAQACCESNFNKSSLSNKYFNFFGMKWSKNCGCSYVELPTKEWDGEKYITIKAKFRKYNNFEEGIEGYYKFITGYARYKNLIGEVDSYTSCELIQKDGWATSPTYTKTLWNLVSKYDLIKYDDIVLNRTTENKIDIFDIQFDLYTVVKGDSLWKIAKKFYGDGSKWTRISEYNNLSSTIIYPNQIIKIPR